MLQVLKTRFQQGHRTIGFPEEAPVLPDRFRGLPAVDSSKCPTDCQACIGTCPTQAITREDGAVRVDMGRCLFCVDCERGCPTGAIRFTNDYRLAARKKEDLIVDGRTRRLAEALDAQSRRLFGRSLKLRQVSAGGCNACEADLNVLGTVVFDLSRFGIQFVASPRHADGVVVTGPVTCNMREALHKTYEAVPSPKLVIAVGACAISGGPYIGHDQCAGGASAGLPVDLFIPGCPPHPVTILDGLLRLLGQIQDYRVRS